MTALPLVLLPGLLNTAEVWSFVTPHLGAIETQALDLVAADDVDDIARAVLARAPPRFALAGFSFGGIVALACAALAPARITALALVATNAGTDSDATKTARQTLIERALAGQYEGISPRLTKLNQHPSTQNDPTILAIRDRMSAEVGAAKFVAHSKAVMARPDRHAVLATLTAPITIIVGRHDLVTPLAESEAMVTAQPRARLYVIEDAGHMVVLEQPAKVAALLRTSAA